MKKRIVLGILAVMTALSMIACDGNTDKETGASSEIAEVSSQTETSSEESSSQTESSEESSTSAETQTEESGPAVDDNAQITDPAILQNCVGMWMLEGFGEYEMLEISDDQTYVFYGDNGVAEVTGSYRGVTVKEGGEPSDLVFLTQDGETYAVVTAALGSAPEEDRLYLADGATYSRYIDTGAASGARSPKDFQETDQIFLGDWKCTNDEFSELKIEEADANTGGYKLTFTFYRIAEGEAYANRTESGLSINQGYLLSDIPFYGTLEKTDDGIRFTVTETEFEYISAGDVYEYVLK